MSYSRIEKTTLPSALSGFTSEFEMDQVGHTRYCHRTKFSLHTVIQLSFKIRRLHSNLETLVKPHEQLVQVSSMPYSTYTPCLSTS